MMSKPQETCKKRTLFVALIGVAVFVLSAFNIQSFRLEAREFLTNAGNNEDLSRSIIYDKRMKKINNPKGTKKIKKKRNKATPRKENNPEDVTTIDKTPVVVAATTTMSEARQNSAAKIRHVSRKLEQHNLTFSARQQQKFQSKRDIVPQIFHKKELFATNAEIFAALPIDAEMAYIHIWKSGGTTVTRQVRAAIMEKNESPPKVEQTHLGNISQPYYMTFVRDPFEHFLSGWAECGYREASLTKRSNRYQRRCKDPSATGIPQEGCIVLEWMEHLENSRKNDEELKLEGEEIRQNMDRMVYEWLKVTRTASRIGLQRQKGFCSRHSFPQANFLIRDRSIMDEMVLVADLREIKLVFPAILNLPYSDNVETGRNSTTVYEKQLYFPSHRVDWLSEETILAVCEFVAIDYFLFDFDPPEVCRDFLANYMTHDHSNHDV